MQNYLNLMKEILDTASVSPDRTKTGRLRVFGRELRFDLSDGSIPAVTTRKINLNHGIEELLWMIRGSVDVRELQKVGVPIWNGWAVTEASVNEIVDETFPEADPLFREQTVKELLAKYEGSIGEMYGHRWRRNPGGTRSVLWPIDSFAMEDLPSDKLTRYREIYDENVFMEPALAEKIPFEVFARHQYIEDNDQLGELVRLLKREPFSSRLVVDSWDPRYVPFSTLSPQANVLLGRGALAVCHMAFQCFVEKAPDGGPHLLSLKVIQRSADLPLGVSTNLVFYGTLLHLLAHVSDLRPKELIWSGGDVHVYANQVEGAQEQVTRTPLAPPKIKINPEARDLFKIQRSDIEVIGYESLPAIKYPVSI